MSNEIVNGHTKKQFLQTKATAININFHFLLQKNIFSKKKPSAFRTYSLLNRSLFRLHLHFTQNKRKRKRR
jgi:hypothetical protein